MSSQDILNQYQLLAVEKVHSDVRAELYRLRTRIDELMRKMADRSSHDTTPGYKKWDVCRFELHAILYPPNPDVKA